MIAPRTMEARDPRLPLLRLGRGKFDAIRARQPPAPAPVVYRQQRTPAIDPALEQALTQGAVQAGRFGIFLCCACLCFTTIVILTVVYATRTPT